METTNTKETIRHTKEESKVLISRIKADQDELIRMLKDGYAKKVRTIEEESQKRRQEILASWARGLENGEASSRDSDPGNTEPAAASSTGSAKDKAALKSELEAEKREKKALLSDAKTRLRTTVDKARWVKYQTYAEAQEKIQMLRNGRLTPSERILLSWQELVNTFHFSQFLLHHSLHIAIVIFFITCIIAAPLTGNGNLLSMVNILSILEQSSVRIFYALGVACLILIGGTDLSLGRMVALGSVITSLILHPGRNIVSIFSLPQWDFSALPVFLRLILALLLSISFCVLFSSFSGFFTAKLNIHPFISTLATQMIIYGLLFFATGGTPTGSIDSGIKELIGGRWTIPSASGAPLTFPKLIIPAVIAAVVAWFIWNKTVFGKNMYAVGGNPEAATVSGINVFRMTMGVFILAGVFYGLGALFEAFKANASAGTGQGYELDAIAACVVGGISFSGGIGKISGAIAGVIIFTALSYCLTFLEIDTNLQFVLKGLIIIVAVALDRIKYVKNR